MPARRTSPITGILKAVVRLYQLTLSKVIGPHCRFYPSCSAYCIEALDQHGWCRGLWLSVKRIGRCHPWHPGGYDPVPPQEKDEIKSDE